MRLIKLKSYLLGVAMLAACAHANADEVTADTQQNEFRSMQYVYDRCKEALSGEEFDTSYCAAYMEGYTRGGFVSGLTILGQSDNQSEIMEKVRLSKCHNLSNGVPRREKIKWLATYLVDWIEGNEAIIQEESAFLTRPAGDVLYTITTDERFCTNPSMQEEHK